MVINLKRECRIINVEPFCDTEEFRGDIKELCASCGLAQYIMDGIEKQIVFQARQQRDILSETKFLEYIDAEIKSAQKTMMEMNLNMRRHETERRYVANIPNTTMVFIWNKERIKALNRLLADLQSKEKNSVDSFSLKPEPLSHAQICLIRIYEGKPVTKTNSQSVAEAYEHLNPNAGRVLLKKYNLMDDERNRLLRRDLESDIETIKPLLSREALKIAESELVKIKNKQR
ncbi:hypothetical protein [Spirosoma gilvum]